MLLRTFVDCLSMGGNLLLDIGPKEDGTIPAEQIAVLKEFGRWTKKHKEAIYETRAGIPCEHFQGYTTLNKAGDILYLYLPYKPNGPIDQCRLSVIYRTCCQQTKQILLFVLIQKCFYI